MSTDLIVCVTADVEVDKSATYAVSAPATFHGTTEAIPARLDPLFREFGVTPTYLVSSEVLDDDESVAVLRDVRGRAEVGTHLHADLVEPARRVEEIAGVKLYDFASDYGPDVQLSKLRTLTEAFRRRIGLQPTAFRAGRFGADADTLRALAALGYVVDSSVTPHLYWTSKRRVVSYRDAPDQPYRPAHRRIDAVGNLPIVEMPVSVVCRPGSRGPGFAVVSRLIRLPVVGWWMARACGRFGLGLPDARWLRPTYADGAEMRAVVADFAARYEATPPVFLVMMFHPIEFYPGASPYASSWADVQRLCDRFRHVLDDLADRGARFCGLTEAARLTQAYVRLPHTDQTETTS